MNGLSWQSFDAKYELVSLIRASKKNFDMSGNSNIYKALSTGLSGLLHVPQMRRAHLYIYIHIYNSIYVKVLKLMHISANNSEPNTSICFADNAFCSSTYINNLYIVIYIYTSVYMVSSLCFLLIYIYMYNQIQSNLYIYIDK